MGLSMRFDVALWRSWPSLFPDRIGELEADDAFSAVVQLMHVYGLTEVACASARAKDHSLVYRGFRVKGVPHGPICFTGRRWSKKPVKETSLLVS